MTKTICDICGKELGPQLLFVKELRNREFAISSNGRIWDICGDCRSSMEEWINERKIQACDSKIFKDICPTSLAVSEEEYEQIKKAEEEA